MVSILIGLVGLSMAFNAKLWAEARENKPPF